MILCSVVLIGLLAASVSGAAVKGRADEYRATKGAAPVADYRRDLYEQRTVAYATKGGAAPAEQAKLADSEVYQQREEAKQQFYEAQPQLREPENKSDLYRKPAPATKTEERAEEQIKLVQAPEQVKYDDYPQQREEAPVQQAKAEVKGAVKQQEQRALTYEATKAYDKYEARPQVREEAAPASPVQAAAAPAGYSKTSAEERRHEEQIQYTAQAPEEQRYESHREEVRSAVKSPPAVAQRTEFVQQEEALQQQQAAVELTKEYEQRRYEEHSEQQFAGQVREEQVKGGLRAPGAEAEPYAFDYAVEGSTRREQGDKDGVVRGQYTLQNPDGTQRIVDYVADQDGFRAQVRTNEFGTEGQQQVAAAAPAPVPVRAAYGEKTRYATQEQVVVAAAPAVKSPAPVVQVAEVVRAGSYQEAAKGVAAVEQAPQQQLELKTAPAPVVVAHEPEPYKGQRVEETVQRAAAPEPIKSAELRTPKAIGSASYPSPAQRGIIVTRASGFESATAHRPVVHAHPVPVAAPVALRPQPVVSVVRHQLVAPVRGYQVAPHHHHHSAYPYRQPPVVVAVPQAVSRSQLQHDRYPPAASAVYRRDHLANPRVSFYANRDIEDEQPVGFEHPIGQI